MGLFRIQHNNVVTRSLLLAACTVSSFTSAFLQPSSSSPASFGSAVYTTPTCLALVAQQPVAVRSTQLNAKAKAAASPEEDLEMTRQIILGSLSKKTEGGSGDGDSDGGQEDAAESTSTTLDNVRPTNDLMIRAAMGETTERTPVWLFRQAGRHLPEYTAYKKETGRNFLQLLKFPESVAECTLQPVRRYPLDAAILFSDILVIPQALGLKVTMPGGVGILVPEPLTGPEQVVERMPAALLLPNSQTETAAFVQTELSHVIASVTQIRSQMKNEGVSIPLIGFSAAPWTLLFYMVGGSSKKNTKNGVNWLEQHPKESKQLMDMLTRVVIEYLSAQVKAGAHMLQVFEAMGMMIDDANFEKHALPCMQVIAKELKKRHPDVPLMVFSRGACYANAALAKMDYDVVTMDGNVKRKTARKEVGTEQITLQGNYDPRELIEDEGDGKTPETVRATAKSMLQELGPQRLIANLGEGLGGKESPALVQAFVDAIHEESEIMISEAAVAVAAASK